MKMVCSVYVMMEDINYKNEGPNCIFLSFYIYFIQSVVNQELLKKGSWKKIVLEVPCSASFCCRQIL